MKDPRIFFYIRHIVTSLNHNIQQEEICSPQDSSCSPCYFNNKLPFAACRTIIDKHAQEIYKYCHYNTYYMTPDRAIAEKEEYESSIRMVSYQLATSIAASVFPENASVIPLIRFPAGSEEKLRSNGEVLDFMV